MKIKIAREFTNPIITLRGINLISLAAPANPSISWKTPARITVARKNSIPYSRATGAMMIAVAAVAAEIIAGLPPRIEVVIAMTKLANSPTLGSTPARIEKAIASGINAIATTNPASDSLRNNLGLVSASLTDGFGR